MSIGTLTAFAAESSQPEPEIGRVMQNIGQRVNGEVVLDPAYEELFYSNEIRFFELDQVTPFDFSRTIESRLEEGQELFRIDRDGRLAPWSASDRLEQFSAISNLREGMTLAELGDALGVDVDFLPRTVRAGDNSYNSMRAQGKSPIIGNNGVILMWVPQAFFEMTYEEFNELAEQLLTTAVIIQTQETVDILREHWLVAQ
jgi:hypothetical protein